jgi:uncharacterized repeat protein (TIGR03806 family)
MLKSTIFAIICVVFSGAFMHLSTPKYPEKLSDWGIFEGKMANMQPKPGVVPYALNTPLYSDYAEKARFIRMPQGASVPYSTNGVLDFPAGTLIVKSFYYSDDMQHPGDDKTIVETRLLTKEGDNWKALTYVWNDEQTDAVLDIAGDEKQVKFIDKDGVAQNVRYVIPNQNQCKGCHNVNDKMSPIGPSVSQMNGELNFPEGKQNQLDYWKNSGLMSNVPEHNAIPRTAVWNDPSTGDLNARARAYLAINCAHCHRKEGPAQTSGLYLTENENEPMAFGINKTPIAAGNGSGGRLYDITPGDANASILWYRMQTTDPGERMPELGRNLLHKEGIALIKDWINQLK